MIGQSRGWLFTLPLVAVVSIAVVSDRLRVRRAPRSCRSPPRVIPVHRLLGVYNAPAGSAAQARGCDPRRHGSRLCCPRPAMVLGTAGRVGGAADPRPAASRGAVACRSAQSSPRSRSRSGRSAAAAATHGDPIRFCQAQWHGFSHPPTASRIRVPFRDRRQRPLRLLAGGAGRALAASRSAVSARTTSPTTTCFTAARPRSRRGRTASSCGCSRTRASSASALFAAFLVAAIAAALRARGAPDTELDASHRGRRPAAAGRVADPRLGRLVLGDAGPERSRRSASWGWLVRARRGPPVSRRRRDGSRAPTARAAARSAARPRGAGSWAVAGARSPRRSCSASRTSRSARSRRRAMSPQRNPASRAAATSTTAADLNPLSADPGRLGGTIALRNGLFTEAEHRSARRSPASPAAGSRGSAPASRPRRSATASRPTTTSRSRPDQSTINQPAITQALARVNTTHPLTPAEAFRLLVVVTSG